MAKERAEAYGNTERVSLVSSFACSLFLGKVAPIDWADGSGMSLMDVRTKSWWPECLEATAPELARRLGSPVFSGSVLGPPSPYMRDRFGLPAEARVVAFTGDNPSSLAGMGMTEGDVGLSLGTSDVVFVWLRRDEVKPDGGGGGVVFANPVDEDAYMAILW